MSARWMRTHWTIALVAVVLAGTVAACSGGSESGSGSGGSGSVASTGQGGSGQGGSGQGGMGTGGSSCGDLQTDPMNCGICNNRCAPGQTCEAGACTCGSTTAAFAADVQPILTASCALNNCHKPSVVNGIPVAPKQGLDLSDGMAYASLVGTQSGQCATKGGRALVVPSSPSESYLIDKLMGVDLCEGKRMPPLTALSTDKIQTISDWICAGAQND